MLKGSKYSLSRHHRKTRNRCPTISRRRYTTPSSPGSNSGTGTGSRSSPRSQTRTRNKYRARTGYPASADTTTQSGQGHHPGPVGQRGRRRRRQLTRLEHELGAKLEHGLFFLAFAALQLLEITEADVSSPRLVEQVPVDLQPDAIPENVTPLT